MACGIMPLLQVYLTPLPPAGRRFLIAGFNYEKKSKFKLSSGDNQLFASANVKAAICSIFRELISSVAAA
jgi:hypothetical protein